MKRDSSFGVAEFRIVCEPDRIYMVIHKDHIVAEIKKNVYDRLFSYCVKTLGGRKDKDWVEQVD